MRLRDNCLILCLFLTLGTAAPAFAGDAPAATPVTAATAGEAADPVHELITRQMNAIRERDADRAFSCTTTEFHDHYNTAQNFLSHMRFEQRPLYNHKNYTFLDRHDIGDGSLLQKVRVEDSYGAAPVTVIFRLQKQDNGTWLIDSFSIIGSTGDDDARPI